MKRILALLLALCLLFCLAACENEDTTSDTTGDVSQNQSTTPAISETPTLSLTPTETSIPTTSTTPTLTATSTPTANITTKPTETSNPTTSAPSPTPSTSAKPTLPFDIQEGLFDGGNALALTDKGISGLTANRILNRSSYEIFHAYIFDNFSRIETKDWEYRLGDTTHVLKQYAVPESVVYQYAAKFFNIDTATKNLLKASDRYDSSKGTYWVCPPDLWFQGYDAIIKGYESLGNDEYVLYVQAVETDHLGSPHLECGTTKACIVSEPCFKTKIKATGTKSFVITSFDYIDKIPSNITKI